MAYLVVERMKTIETARGTQTVLEYVGTLAVPDDLVSPSALSFMNRQLRELKCIAAVVDVPVYGAISDVIRDVTSGVTEGTRRRTPTKKKQKANGAGKGR